MKRFRWLKLVLVLPLALLRLLADLAGWLAFALDRKEGSSSRIGEFSPVLLLFLARISSQPLHTPWSWTTCLSPDASRALWRGLR